MSTVQPLTWEAWKAELNRYCQETCPLAFPHGVIEATGEDNWRGYFDDGWSPADALEEDRSYWEE